MSTNLDNLSYTNNVYVDPSGNFNVFRDQQPDANGNFEIVQYRVTYIRTTTVSLTSVYPIQVIFRAAADNSTVSGSFYRNVAVDMTNINTLNISNCTFNIDTIDGNSANLAISGSAGKMVNMVNAPAIGAQPQKYNKFYYNGSSVFTIAMGTNVNIDNTNQIFLTSSPYVASVNDLIEPNSLVSSFELHLVAGVDGSNNPYPMALSDVTTNLTFHLDSDLKIQSTLFAAMSTFAQHGHSLTFNDCRFVNGLDYAANRFLAVTNGNVTFQNNTVMSPSIVQINAGTIWNFNGGNVTVANSLDLIMELSDGTYTKLPDFMNIIKNLSIRLVGQKSAYVLGTPTNVIHYPLNILIDNDSSYELDGKDPLNNPMYNISYYSDAQVFVTNTFYDPSFPNDIISLSLNSLYAQTGPNANVFPYTLNYINGSTGHDNKVIFLEGNFFNNGGNIVGNNFANVITINNPHFTYQNTTGVVNVGNELPAIVGNLGLIQNAGPMSFLVPAGLNAVFNLLGNVNLINCTLNDTTTYNVNTYDLSITQSVFNNNGLTCNLGPGNMSVSGSWVNVNGANVPFVLNQPAAGALTLTNNVFDMAANNLIVGGEGSAVNNISNNTFNVNFAALDLTVCTPTMFNTSNSFNNVFNLNFAVVALSTPANVTVNLAANRDVALSAAATDLSNDNKLVIAGNLVSWNGNSSVVQPVTPPSLSIVNTNFSSNTLNSMAGAYVSYLAANNNTNPCTLAFNNVNFVCNSSTVSFTCDVDAAAVVARSVNTNVVLDGSGNFLLGNDAIVVNNSKVLVFNGTGTNASRNLYGSTIGVAFVSASVNTRAISIKSLAIVISANTYSVRLSDNNANTDINMVVLACGLQLVDQMAAVHNVNLMSGSDINLSTTNTLSEALSIESTANSGATFNLNSVSINASTNNLSSMMSVNCLGANSINMTGVNASMLVVDQIIYIEGAVQDAPAGDLNKVLTIDNTSVLTINPGGSYNRFIVNKDSMLLNLNVKPAGPAPAVAGTPVRGGWIQVDLGTPQSMTTYGMLTDNPGYSPSSWVIAGSNDGTTWASLDEKSGISMNAWNPYNWAISNNTPYRYMRFIVRSVITGDIITPTQFYLAGPSGPIYAAVRGSATFSSDVTPGHQDNTFCLNQEAQNNNYYMASTYSNGAYNGSTVTTIASGGIPVGPYVPPIKQNVWWSGLIGMWSHVSRKNLSLLWQNNNYTFPLVAASTTDPQNIDATHNPGAYLLPAGAYNYSATVTNDSNDWNVVTIKKVSDDSVVKTLINGQQPWTTATVTGSFILNAATKVYADFSNNYYAYSSKVDLSLTNTAASDSVVDVLGAPLTYPLKGTAVKFAEAWNIVDPALANGGEVITNNCNDLPNLAKGLVFSSLSNLSAPCPWLSGGSNNILNYLHVYSHEAETAAGFKLNLNKQYTNSTTCHTGKLIQNANNSSSFVDSYNAADADLKGWLYNPIDFDGGTNKIILMPPSNPALLQISPIADMSNPVAGNVEWSFGAYTVKNTNSINGIPILQWLHDYMYRNDSNVAVNEDIAISQGSVPLVDPNYNNAALTANFSKTIEYGFYSINNQNAFYFLNDITMSTTWTDQYVSMSSVSVPNNNSGSLTFTFAGVDTNNSNLSEPVTITLGNDTSAWTIKPFTLTPNVSLYSNGTTSNPAFPFITNIVNRSDPNQLYVFDITANPSQDFRSSGPINFFNNNIQISPQFTTDTIVVNNQRQYVATAYIGLIALANGGTPLTVMNFDTTVGNTFGLYYNDGQSRGSVTIAGYHNANGSWSVTPNDMAMNNINNLYRFQVTIKSNNNLDQYVLNNIWMNFTLTAKNNMITLTPASLSVTTFTLPLYVDVFNGNFVDGTIVKPVWNAAPNSQYYQEMINRNMSYKIYVQLSGLLYGMAVLKLDASATYSNNGFDMTAVTLYMASDNTYTLTNNRAYMNFYDVNNMVINVNFPLSNQYIVGDFSTNFGNDNVFNWSNGQYANVSGANNLTVNYVENLQQHTIGITLDRAVDSLNNESVTPKPTMNSFGISDNFNTNKLMPSTSDWQQQSTVNTLIPANKFTQYYVNLLSNTSGITTTGGNAVLGNTVLNGTITFLNENGGVPGDLEIIGNGINAAYTTTTYTNEGVSAQSCFFRRRAADAIPEEPYKILHVFVTLNNVDNTNSNYGHLPTGPILIGTIDFTNCATTSVALSQLFLGNWNITPSGDGKYVLFRNVYDGSDPSLIPNAGSVNNTSYLSFTLPPRV